jgi:hypothetical protein
LSWYVIHIMDGLINVMVRFDLLSEIDLISHNMFVYGGNYHIR